MKSQNPPEEFARARLHDAGLRATRPRVLVYTTLRNAGGHLSVDEVVALLTKRGHEVPRMSVYNVVSDLATAGLVMCADTGPGRALYEANNSSHHHFVCRTCGKIQDVPCTTGRSPCLAPPPSLGATVDESQVIFRGCCKGCSKDQPS